MNSYRKCVHSLAVVFLSAVLAACGSSKKIDDSGKPLPLTSFEAAVKLKKSWSAGVGDGQGKNYDRLAIGLSPQGSGASSVYAASVDGVVSRFSASGKREWRIKLKEKLSAGVGVGEKLVVIGTANGEIVSLDAENGKELWRVDVQGEVLAAPQVSASRIIVQTFDGRILGMQHDDGAILWTYTSDVPLLTLRGSATPLIYEGQVFAGLASGKLVVLSERDGGLVWDKPIAIAKGQSEIERIVDVDGTPLVSGNAVYAASFQGNLFAFTARNGNPRWRFETSTYRQLAEGFDNIYLVDEKSRLYAIDSGSGEVRWEQSQFLHRQLSAPVVFAGYLVVADYKGYLHVLSQVDGSVVGRARVDNSGVRAPMRVIDDRLQVYTNDGKLVALTLQRLKQ